jgi:SnoaL-like domain
MPPTFRTAVEAHDFDAVSELFTDDIRMRSPIARRIYRGRAAVIDVLRAVSTVFEDFTYEHEISSSSGDDHVLLFSARVGDFEIQGCDLLHYRDDGLIDQLTVMLRPLKAVLAFEERIRQAYARTVSTRQPTACVSADPATNIGGSSSSDAGATSRLTNVGKNRAANDGHGEATRE